MPLFAIVGVSGHTSGAVAQEKAMFLSEGKNRGVVMPTSLEIRVQMEQANLKEVRLRMK